MAKDTRGWSFQWALEVTGTTSHDDEVVRRHVLDEMAGNAARRGLSLDPASLTHHQHPFFPGDPRHRVFKAKEAR